MQPNPRPTTYAASFPGAGAATVLLAEDDPPSRAFLAQALQSLGWTVHGAATGEHALEAASSRCFDLLLLDRNLPIVDGASLLQRLRQDSTAASQNAIAVACSADWDVRSKLAARRAGFVETLAKPCTIAQLRSALQKYQPATARPLVDAGSALEAAGSAANAAALQRLFGRELELLESGLPELIRDPGAFDQQLHRLVSSCGFCGATALATTAATLRQALLDGNPGQQSLEQFALVLAATRRHIEST